MAAITVCGEKRSKMNRIKGEHHHSYCVWRVSCCAFLLLFAFFSLRVWQMCGLFWFWQKKMHWLQNKGRLNNNNNNKYMFLFCIFVLALWPLRLLEDEDGSSPWFGWSGEWVPLMLYNSRWRLITFSLKRLSGSKMDVLLFFLKQQYVTFWRKSWFIESLPTGV